jgi:hypothetical protein
MTIQAQIRHQTLQLRVLLAQLPQLPQLVQPKTRVLLLPQVKRLLADPMLAADLHHHVARLRLTQYPQNLLFTVSALTHNRLSSRPSREPSQTKILNFNAA